MPPQVEGEGKEASVSVLQVLPTEYLSRKKKKQLTAGLTIKITA